MFFLRSYFSIPILFAAGGIIFKLSAPPACPPLAKDEKIFVLTGDIRRIPFGLHLLESHPRRRMYIIGVGGIAQGGGDYFSAIIPKDEKAKVVIESESRSTYENAIAVREITSAQSIKKFALVTTEDHMTRALLLMQRRMPDAEIIPCPVPLHGMPAARRIERWGTEYFKYLGTLAGMESKK